MKKGIIIAAMLLTVLGGCQNSPDAGLFNGSSRRTLETTIVGKLKNNGTKTELSDDGSTVKWAKGDSIGLFNVTFTNIGARLEDASAGNTEGVFKAGMAGKAMYAYYPYSSSAKVTRTTVDLNLPASQIQRGDRPDMHNDLKVGTYVSGSASEGLVMEFTQKLTLLDFVLTPLDVLEGEKLESISFTDAGKALAGNFTLDLKDVTAPLSFAEGYSQTVTLTFADRPVLTAGQTVNGWMFVNPSVKNHEHIQIAIRTSKHIVTVDVNTRVAFSAGYKYRMPLDLPVLKSNGYLSVQDKAEVFDFTILGNAGIYDIDKDEYKVKYEEGVNQYASYTASDKYDFRIQSLPQGYAVSVRTPQTLNVDTFYDIVVSKVGDIDVNTGTFQAKVVKSEGGFCWLLDEINKTAYVIIK